MEIKDLKPRQGSVEVTATVIDKSEPRSFDKQGNKGTVCKATIKDDSGSIVLTLWNDEVSKISIGDKIKITNGYVSEWQGELQLSAGKFGKLEVVEKGASVPAPQVYTNILQESESDSSDDSSDDSEDYDDPGEDEF